MSTISTTTHKGQVLPLAHHMIPITQNTTFHASFNNGLDGKTLSTTIRPMGHTKSLTFNGTTTYASIGDKANFSFPTNIFTIEFWMKAENTSSSIGIIGKRGTPWEYSIHGVSGTLVFSAYDSTGNVVYSITGIPYDINWVHFAFVANGTNAYVYKNGVQVGTAAKSANNMSDTTAMLEFGRAGDNTGLRYFKGSLNEVRLWNVARSIDQIKTDMYQSLNGDEAGMMGCWKLNEGDGKLISDYNATGNDGLIEGVVAWGNGRTVATLQNANSRYGNSLSIVNPSSFLAYPKTIINTVEGTISFWLYAYGVSANYPVFSSGVDGAPGTFDLLIDSTQNPRLRVYDASATPLSNELRPTINLFNSWNHITITWKAGEFLRFYANGNKLAETLTPVNWQPAFTTNATGFYLGAGIKQSPNAFIEDMRIDKVAVTDSEIVSWFVGGPHYSAST